MGKSEILMLLAGVALSIMLAMVAIPMFSSGSEMADRQQVQQELMSIKSSIPLIKALEGGDYVTVGTVTKGKITAENIMKHLEGFEAGTTSATDVKGSKGGLANFTIKDEDSTNKVVTVTVTSSDVDLDKLSRLESICDYSYGGNAVGNDKKPTKTSLV